MLDALKEDHTRIRIFGKPEAHVGRRMGVVLSLLQGLLWEVEWLPALTVVAALLYVADRWAEEWA